MPSALFLGLALLPHVIFSYNIDTSYPIVYTDPEPGAANNSFGFSLALSWRRNSDPATSLFVGAPQIPIHGEGRVYRCTQSAATGALSCRKLIVDSSSSPVEVPLQRSYITLITGKSRGLGASMATGESMNLTVCAPYTLIHSKSRRDPNSRFLKDMRGYCYDVPNATGNKLYRDNDVLRSEIQYPLNTIINSMYGFSVDYAKNKRTRTVERIIGQPRLNQVAMKPNYMGNNMLYELDEISNLGYSVASGYFFNKNDLVFVAGAPGWMRKGRVEYRLSSIYQWSYIYGSVLGEYFGASLAAGDFDGDGLDDLAVGAPHWGEVDLGRVYIFCGRTDGTFARGLVLQGATGYAQFGYTLTSADLDSDGISDLVVGAPWEGSGIVYVYYGSSAFRYEHSTVSIIQRIDPAEFRQPAVNVERFGFALSHPLDTDNNGYPDLAIGAYKSGHAFILRGRPVIKTELRLFSYPTTLQNSTSSFVVSVCLKYRGVNAPATQDFAFQMTVDEVYKRVERGFRNFSHPFSHDQSRCENETITFLRGHGNPVNPVTVRVKHSVKEKVGQFCSSCAVLSRRDVVDTVQIKVPFNTGCEGGDICKALLSLTGSLDGTREDNEWIVGSGDISLNLAVTNDGEPAYQTQLSVDIPNGIRLRKSLPMCREDKGESGITLVCDIGDPLVKGSSSALSVDLDMDGIVESIGGTRLIFNITKWTRSDDLGTRDPKQLHLKVKNVAYVTLTGLANEESHDYSRTENKSMVPIRHTYQVRKVGETPITEAQLTINVPIRRDETNISFVNIHDPNLIDSTGKVYQCSVSRDGGSETREFHSPQESDDPFLQRRRRENSEDETTPLHTAGPSVTEAADDAELEEDTSEKSIRIESQTTDRTIYLNCSSENVTCVEITCKFSLKKTTEDIGTVTLDLSLDANAFYTSKEDSLAVQFSTDANVKIILPFISDPSYIRNTTASASTMLYNIPEPQKLAGWIIPFSLIFGILLFCLLAFILFRVGFFNRPHKAKTAKAKEMEMMIKPSREEEFECYGATKGD